MDRAEAGYLPGLKLGVPKTGLRLTSPALEGSLIPGAGKCRETTAFLPFSTENRSYRIHELSILNCFELSSESLARK